MLRFKKDKIISFEEKSKKSKMVLQLQVYISLMILILEILQKLKNQKEENMKLQIF